MFVFECGGLDASDKEYRKKNTDSDTSTQPLPKQNLATSGGMNYMQLISVIWMDLQENQLHQLQRTELNTSKY